MALFMRWFGEKDDELGCTLNGSFITSCTGQRGENATPFLHKAKGARLLWLSEVPQHDDLPMTVLKPFAEQQGASMSSRALHRAPENWRPMALAVLTSNFPAKLSERQQDDEGAERRLVPYFCKHKFVARPTLLTHRQADPLVNQRIAAGAFNAQLTAFFVALEPTLGDAVCPKNEVEPEPRQRPGAAAGSLRGRPEAPDRGLARRAHAAGHQRRGRLAGRGHQEAALGGPRHLRAGPGAAAHGHRHPRERHHEREQVPVPEARRGLAEAQVALGDPRRRTDL